MSICMRHRLTYLGAFVGLLLACGPAHRSYQGEHTTMVEWVGAFTEAERNRCLDAWEHHRKSWARDNGTDTPRVDVLKIYSAQTLHDGVHGRATWGRINLVEVVTGVRQELPFAYHELQHLAVNDPEHASPKWADWNELQRQSLLSWSRYWTD